MILRNLDNIIIGLTAIAVIAIIVVSIKNYRDAKIRKEHYEAFLKRREQRRRDFE